MKLKTWKELLAHIDYEVSACMGEEFQQVCLFQGFFNNGV